MAAKMGGMATPAKRTKRRREKAEKCKVLGLYLQKFTLL